MAGWQAALETFVADHEAERNRLQQALSEVDLNIKAFRKAGGVASGSSAKAINELIEQQLAKLQKLQEKLANAELSLQTARAALEVATEANKRGSERSSPRRLSAAWHQILEFIRDAGDVGVALEDVNNLITRNDLGIKDAAVRSQLSIYSGDERGFVEQLGHGRYRITSKGISVLEKIAQSR